MMDKIINLGRYRKKLARDAKAADAPANRARHGRSRAEKVRDAAEAAHGKAMLDGHKIDCNVPDPPPSGRRG